MSDRDNLWITDIEIPTLIRVRQAVERTRIEPEVLPSRVVGEWTRIGLRDRVASGSEIAILVGSRGIANLVEVIAATVNELRSLGAFPIVVPSMGSHGGATADGQVQVLAELGVTEESISCPIRSTLDTVVIGETSSGFPVRLDRCAAECAGVVVINRVKPHTHFRGEVESGIAKMLALGAGNHHQAQAIHAYGSTGLAQLIPEVAKVGIDSGHVLAGLALIENGRHELALVEAIGAKELEAREPVLLDLARSYLPRLPIDDVDLLIVDQIGKDISGMGMDTNVTGRVGALDLSAFETPNIGCIVVLGLTPATGGNATGVGLADIITARLDEKIDWHVTYANSLTAQSPRAAARPLVAPSDRDAIGAALRWLGGPPRAGGTHIIRIKDTLALEYLWMSTGALSAALAEGASLSDFGPAEPLRFSPSGDLI